MDDSPVDDATVPEVVALWERHFRDPEFAYVRADALLAREEPIGQPARAWCELTIAFHHFLTAQPLEARRFLADAQAGFTTAGDRRGQLLAEIGAARLAIVERSPLAARERLLTLYPEAQ